jgi:putative sigma-54 modulation protein
LSPLENGDAGSDENKEARAMKKGHHTPGGVNVEVKGKNLALTPALHDQVVNKMQRLDKYLDRLNTIEVELCTEKTREAAHHNMVDVTAHVHGRTVRARTINADMYAAVDEAVDKLYRQLNRTKERMKSHHGNKAGEALLQGEDSVGSEFAPNGEPPIEAEIRVERLDVKPMFEDEAVDELEEGGRSFYVFLNARNEQVNVLYRHADGSYGLIEPGTR